MESEPQVIVTSPSPSAAGELLARHSSFTSLDIERLFEAGSPLLRENSYAISAPLNNVRASRSDWRVFNPFCAERHLTPLPATQVVMREFIETSVPAAEPRSVATVERYLSTIAHAHTLCQRIVQLGGEPDFVPDGLSGRSHAGYVPGGSLVEMIKEDLVAERIAIDSYRELIQYLGEQDPTTSRMLKEILAVEENHADELADLLVGLPAPR